MIIGKRAKTALIIVIVLITLVVTLWLTIPKWVPKVVSIWLPAGTQLSLTERPHFIKRGISISGFQFSAGDCRLADAGPLRLVYLQRKWLLHNEWLDIDTHCLNKLAAQPDSADENIPLSIAEIQRQLPLFDISLDRLRIMPWQSYQGRVKLSNNGEVQRLTFQGNLVAGVIVLNNQQMLAVESFRLKIPDSQDVIQLNGELKIPVSLDAIPEQGDMRGEFVTSYVEKPLLMILSWQQKKGHLTITPQGEQQSLLDVPWELSIANKRLIVEQGQWRWPYASQLFTGGIQLMLTNWNKNYSDADIEARLNVITQGANGKGNAVLTFNPGHISMNDSNLPFQFTGKVNQDAMSFYVAIPGTLNGSILNPTLEMMSGALLRATGPLTPDIYLQEARLPLAGIKLTDKGITGRLQTIINASHRYWGKYKLHLDGKSQNFWLDQGHWEWNFWGNGDMPPLKAKWDMSGKGEWNDSLINLQSLSTGFNQIVYGRVTIDKPRLILSSPLNWQRADGAYQAGWQLQAQKTSFAGGGYLPKSTLNINFDGKDPASFQWSGDLSTDKIGPIALRGRWDGQRVRGTAWWPEQSLQVFQTLLPPDLGFKIRSGKLYAQAAFSASEEQGIEAGGHWVVRNGGMWLKDGDLDGLDFVMSYRFKDHIWQLGPTSPIKLRIKKLTNLFEMENISADLQGAYPYDSHHALRLSNVAVDIMKGHISLSALSLPQKRPVTLKVEGVDLSELFTILKPKQFTMSGKVNGELPLFLDHPEWLVRNGWIENIGPLTLRLDKDFVQAITDDNMFTGDVISWLGYMEISRSRSDINLSNLGLLTMDAQITGFNPTKMVDKLIVLNYHHEEDIFQLWRSLRFGDNLQEELREILSSPRENNQ